MPASNTWWGGRWYGPSYPNAGELPSRSADHGSVDADGSLPELDELDPDDLAVIRAAASGPETFVPREEPPPRAGKGSSQLAWAGFAQRHGVEVLEGADRSDIIAACIAAGVVEAQEA